MNINMLRDQDNDPGFYAAACAADPAATNWRGATVYVSADGGATYTVGFSVTAEATMGVTTTVLGDFLGGNIVDELNSVTVRLSHGSLSSTSATGLLAGVNMAVCGDEILFFRDAPMIAENTFRVSGLLRGRRGSEYAMGSHAVGERFVVVDPTKFVRVTQSTADIGVEKLYKAVTSGRTLAATDSRAFTNEGCGLKPYAPVHLGGGRDASGNATLNWVRRGRISGEWRSGASVPLSEETEAYEVEIFEDDTYATVVRTITGITSQTTTYSAADQTTDFGSPQSTIYFRVYQRSAVVGRGHPADGSV
jgi:hypothetical protein